MNFPITAAAVCWSFRLHVRADYESARTGTELLYNK